MELLKPPKATLDNGWMPFSARNVKSQLYLIWHGDLKNGQDLFLVIATSQGKNMYNTLL
jgi:hypothetical protein